MSRLFFLVIGILLLSCNREDNLFKLHQGTDLGINFNNALVQNTEMNILDYMYFYNGGGVAAADFNADGLVDIFLTGNQVSNQLYLNNGNLNFTNVTEEAFSVRDQSWSTGVAVVDVNRDGLLDLYVCVLGDFRSIKDHNKLFVCAGIENGVPRYEEQSEKYGLDFSGFSTQSAWLDYDLDGDLDMFLLNHSVHSNNSFAPRKNFIENYHPTAGDRFFRNDDGFFTDVTKEVGILSNEIGYGLGVVVSDVNMDGYPDLYVGNDFHENDYLYINQRDGSFEEQLSDRIKHTSRFSMGVDAADVNKDGYPDILSLDMLPYDPEILRRSEGEDPLNTFNYKLKYGYNHQYARNAFQVSTGQGHYTELAMYAGIHATDWSWAPLFADFNLDGKEDVFITNGIPKRMNDIDYINFISNNTIQKRADFGTLDSKDMELLSAIPEIKLENRLFIQDSSLNFEIKTNLIQNHVPSYSNGASYADLDNDGDLDIVVNNINASVFIYENLTTSNHGISVKLKGPEYNPNALGTKILAKLEGGGSIKLYEKNNVRGFLSSAESDLILFEDGVEEWVVVWPDRTFKSLEKLSDKQVFQYEKGLDTFNFDALFSAALDFKFKESVNISGAPVVHKENPFNEFDREPLIPWTVSTEGPALAIGDLNGDQLEDIFLGSSKRSKAVILLQTQSGDFIRNHPAIDSMFEEVDALIQDLDSDGKNELFIVNGGNEYQLTSDYNKPHIYGFNEKTTEEMALDFSLTGQVVRAQDYDQDGDVDLFLGARAIPGRYGETPRSFLIENDGKGNFSKSLLNGIEALEAGGMVTDAVWISDQELLVAYEWGKILKFVINSNKITQEVIYNQNGLWQKVIAHDFDGDGDQDIIALNKGMNHRWNGLKVKMYLKDFDGNGKKEQIVTYMTEAGEVPFANKMELETQIPQLKKKFLKAADFAQATITELVDIENASIFTIEQFKSIYLENKDGLFIEKDLPQELQYTSWKDAVIEDFNKDGIDDILIVGNFGGNTIQMGRDDGGYGGILMNKGGTFDFYPVPGLDLDGEIRKVRKIEIRGMDHFVIAENNGQLKIINYE